MVAAGAVAALLTAALIVVAMREGAGALDRWFVASLGILIGVFLSVLAWRGSLPRFYLLGGATAAAGILIAWSGTRSTRAMALFWLAAGAVTLWRFLHAPPVES